MNHEFSLKYCGKVIKINDYFVIIDYTIKVPAEGFLLEFTAKSSSTPITPQPSNSSSTSLPTNITSTAQPSNVSTTSASTTSSTTEPSDSPVTEIGLSIILIFSILLLI